MNRWRLATRLWLLLGLSSAALLALGALALHAAGAAAPRGAIWLAMVLGVGAPLAGGHALLRGLQRELGAEPGDAVVLAESIGHGAPQLAAAQHAAAPGSVLAALQRLQSALRERAQRLRDQAGALAGAAAQLAHGSDELRARRAAQAAALREAGASLALLDASVRHDAGKVQQASRAALDASAVAQHGGQVVGQVVDTMRGIDAASKRIADIVGVIDGIAFQTNLLALNAAVEAARAGEQGRGFAVVAVEVRSLAQRSADAAREIKQLLGASVDRIEQGTALADQAGATLAEVVDAIGRVSHAMADLSAAGNEHGAGMARVGEAMQRIDQAARVDADAVERGAAIARELQQHSTQLLHTLGAPQGALAP